MTNGQEGDDMSQTRKRHDAALTSLVNSVHKSVCSLNAHAVSSHGQIIALTKISETLFFLETEWKRGISRTKF